MPSPGKCPSRAFIGSRQRELPSASHRVTTLVHPRSPVVPFDTPGSARAEIPGHPRGPFRFREAPATASRDQASPADFCNTTRPASTTSSCMTLARTRVAVVPLPSRLPRGRSHTPFGVEDCGPPKRRSTRPCDLAITPLSAAASNDGYPALRQDHRRPGGLERRTRVSRAPLLENPSRAPRASSVYRHGGLECLRHAMPTKAPVPTAPREGSRHPENLECFPSYAPARQGAS